MEYKINILPNKSKIYFTPLFNAELPIRYFNNLRNTYFWYDDIGEETFCLLYEFDGKVRGKFSERTGFTVYENNILMQHKLFRGYKDFGKYVLYEYGLTNELYELRDILLQGKYSGLPESAKQTICNFIGKTFGQRDQEFIEKVLYKDPDLLQEIAERYNVKVEFVKEGASEIIIANEVFANHLELIERKNEYKRISKTGEKD